MSGDFIIWCFAGELRIGLKELETRYYGYVTFDKEEELTKPLKVLNNDGRKVCAKCGRWLQRLELLSSVSMRCRKCEP